MQNLIWKTNDYAAHVRARDATRRTQNIIPDKHKQLARIRSDVGHTHTQKRANFWRTALANSIYILLIV